MRESGHVGRQVTELRDALDHTRCMFRGLKSEIGFIRQKSRSWQSGPFWRLRGESASLPFQFLEARVPRLRVPPSSAENVSPISACSVTLSPLVCDQASCRLLLAGEAGRLR